MPDHEEQPETWRAIMSHQETEVHELKELQALRLNKKPYLVVMSGRDLAQRYPLDLSESVIGRAEDAHIPLDDTKASRRHARLFVNGEQVVIEDLQSTNGTYVNNEKIAFGKLRDGDLIGIGTTLLKLCFQSELDSAFHEELVNSARNDPLTGCLNRRLFDRHLEAEYARIDRYGGQVSLLLCDLDGFKVINDRYGHQAGDTVLNAVGRTLRACIRGKIDVAGRYGGEELVILLPETGLPGALIVGEKIRSAIENLEVVHEDHLLKCTISIGVSANSERISTPEALLRAADEKLYAAKANGKNRVEG
jgi:diguanylate cyclase (GGDEF)-like protein